MDRETNSNREVKRKRNGFFLLVATLVLSFSFCSFKAFSDDIPFDTNVPDTGSGATDQTDQGTQPNTPPAAKMPPLSQSKQSELNGTPDDTLEAPKLAAPTNKDKSTILESEKAPADLSGLGKLAPFSDIAVITKRFLPKTHRFEFFPEIGMVINDAFFNDFVVGGRLGFYFTENWGIEANVLSISTSQRGVTNELQTNPSGAVNTTALLTPTSYYGLDAKWDPVYGKVGFLDQKIIPFDLYFSLGGGVTGTSGSSSAPTVHLGVGQLFASSKWLAFRWDISWYGMNATSPVNNSSSFFTNIQATIGASFFFPGANYR